MIDHARHVPLRPLRWSESDATAAIEDIVADGLEHSHWAPADLPAETHTPALPLEQLRNSCPLQPRLCYKLKTSLDQAYRMDEDPFLHHRRIKARTPLRAARGHRGPGHWHVRIRTSVIVCRACGASIPKWHNPRFCPECGAGREVDGALA